MNWYVILALIIGEALGMTPAAVRQQLRRPSDSWRIGTLRRYCEVLQCPLEEALKEAAK